MKTLLLAEDSNTVDDEAEVVEDYYKGQFVKIANLAEELSEYSDLDLYVLSENYGLLAGSDKIESLSEQERERGLDDASELLVKQVSKFDVVVLLLTTEVFKEIIADNWETLVNRAKPDSIWCIGVARSGLENCDTDSLQEILDEIIIYQRVGVAPISNDTRDELLEAIASKSSSQDTNS